jgi:hypothetical protein
MIAISVRYKNLFFSKRSMSNFDIIKDTVKQFNAQIEQFDLDSLNDEEYEEVHALLEKTLLLLTGDEDESEDDEDLDEDL